MFGLFRKKETIPGPVFNDITYITTESKFLALRDLTFNNPKTIIITWFPETQRLLTEFFKRENINDAGIIESRYMHASKIAGHIPVFAEHYPLHDREVKLVMHWPIKTVDVYNSLDEPWMSHFGGDQIMSLVKRMGMKDTESIRHPLIGKAIKNAQDKLSLKAENEHLATSQGEWLKKNLIR